MYPEEYNGYLSGGDKAALKQIIDNGVNYATELGMYVIIDWHVLNYAPSRHTHRRHVISLQKWHLSIQAMTM